MQALRILNRFGIIPFGIIHVGANDGAEFEAYRDARAETVVYIEPISLRSAMRNISTWMK